MASTAQNQFLGPVTVFQERRLPETATPAGYSALIAAYGVDAPLPRTLSAIGAHHRILERDGWKIMTPRHAPNISLEGHLTFALKYEGLDLAVLKRLFLATGPAPIEAIVKNKPTGTYARRVWFLYEWLSGERLNLPDAQTGRYVPVLDPDLQWGVEGETASRYRLRNNLPGTPEFCPLVFQTEKLDQFVAEDLPQQARDVIADVPRDVLARTAAFLLLKDSKSSYAIEGESPPTDRIQRWGRAIGEAGKQPLDEDELLRLQRIVIGNARFIRLGFRDEGGFIGEHDRDTRLPLPDHISARPEDLQSLLSGMIAFDQGPAQHMDAVIAAAILAFGFVYVHPFEDGNGRLHRYLMHHVLSERGYNPPAVVFPVSAAILNQINQYRDTLESYSQRLLPHIRWETTEKFNVRVSNDTGDFYRFFDATPHAEFLYACVKRTIEHDLPNETDFLRRYDEFRRHIENMIEMPERTVDLLFRFLRQNDGKLSNRAKEREFAALKAEEVVRIEAIYNDTFGSSFG
ncbi:Fic family protein [Thalassospira sp. MCCC 1A01428]|uniref:Fic family protein n=1 Tax=Thalassospira sp. MCCC 1A01428 TaxID=1470575 RepID=UPI000A1F5AC5|nr:Fic family protein [Thalassospira sp. MCCC 1A01428]OSQ33695.1 cell filamentation protein Fic [Thalassospira sp. MCCC 1A01428]|tara:strand:+ start:1927 stop:3477 length:1551 start_codon:yes stop_codon:yes gene_type:complete